MHRDGFSFSTDVRVRFAETDAQGIVHNSNYFIWFEVARVEYLERHAGGYQRLRDLGVEALVLETHVRYLQPAKFDDRLVVHARCLDVRGARFRYEYAIERSRRADRRRLDGARHRRLGDDAADPRAALAHRAPFLVRRRQRVVVVVAGGFFFGVVFFGPTRTIFGSAR